MKLDIFKKISILMLISLLFAGCLSSGPASDVPDVTKGEPQWWLNMKGPAYQVLVYSFADSDGDGMGDIQGLISKLDYLNDGNPETTTDLGVEMLWLSPIHPAGSYHGYDVLDYMAVNEKYGTMADFEQLIAECTKRNIKVVMDMVFNHTSSNHPWFYSMLSDEESPYKNYYVHKEPSVTYGSGGMGRFNFYSTAYGSTECFSAFHNSMPDLNCANPAVKREFVKIMKFWLNKGVSGFRFDAAKHIFDQNEIAAGASSFTMNKEFWEDLRTAAQKVKPNVFFIGEILVNEVSGIAPYSVCFDSLWDFSTQELLADKVGRGSTASLLKTIKTNITGLTKPDFVPSYLLSNHDKDRSMSQILIGCGINSTDGLKVLDTDESYVVEAKNNALTRAKTAASLNQTLPGIPWIYYGEEIGMTGIRYANDDVSRRGPMLWTEDKKDSPSFYNSSRMVPGQNSLTPSVEEQSADPDSLLNHYRNLAKLRSESEVIRKGRYEKAWPGYGGRTLMAYFRILEKEDGTEDKVYVVHNVSNIEETRSVPEGNAVKLFWSSIPGKEITGEELNSITVQAGESAVFTVIEK